MRKREPGKKVADAVKGDMSASDASSNFDVLKFHSWVLIYNTPIEGISNSHKSHPPIFRS